MFNGAQARQHQHLTGRVSFGASFRRSQRQRGAAPPLADGSGHERIVHAESRMNAVYVEMFI